MDVLWVVAIWSGPAELCIYDQYILMIFVGPYSKMRHNSDNVQLSMP